MAGYFWELAEALRTGVDDDGLAEIAGQAVSTRVREERMALLNPALTQIPDSYKYGWHDEEKPLQIFQKGLNAETVKKISRVKGEPS